MREEREPWDVLDAVDRLVRLRANDDRVRRLILSVCRVLVGEGDADLQALLAVGEAAEPGSGRQVEIVAARVRAHKWMDQLRTNPREEARVRCVRYTLPDQSAYDPQDVLDHFLVDARNAGIPPAELAAMLVEVFPEVSHP